VKQLELFPGEKSSIEPKKHHDKTHYRGSGSKKRFISKEEYYKSEEWEKKRAFALHRAKHRCQKCGSSKSLEVHHLTYERLYN